MEEREIKVQSVRERKFNGSNETVVWDSCFCLSLLLYMFLVCGFFYASCCFFFVDDVVVLYTSLTYTMCEEVSQISKFEIRRGERERDREMPEHLCLQCFHCHMFQVIQMKKSNKWKCKVCHAKQSRRRVFARSDRAKDVRGVVQHMNMKIGEEEVRNRLKICVQYRFFLTLFFISILNQAARKRDEEEWSSKRSREDFEEEHTFNKRRRGEDYERDDRYVQEEQGMYYDDDDYELEYNSSTMPSHMRDLFEESSTTTTTKRKRVPPASESEPYDDEYRENAPPNTTAIASNHHKSSSIWDKFLPRE